MLPTTPNGLDLTRTYVHLGLGGAATPIEVGPTFWESLTSGARHDLDDGWLMTSFRMADSPATWEMHPAGDEMILLLAGAIDVALQDGDGERVVALQGRGACIVPRGAWHRALVREPSDVLFITPGAGTQQRPA
jgi:hypothetical protein